MLPSNREYLALVDDVSLSSAASAQCLCALPGGEQRANFLSCEGPLTLEQLHEMDNGEDPTQSQEQSLDSLEANPDPKFNVQKCDVLTLSVQYKCLKDYSEVH